MSARLRHGIYWAVSLSTIGPILLLEAGGKLANAMEWRMFHLQEWAFPPSKARLPAPELGEKWRQ